MVYLRVIFFLEAYFQVVTAAGSYQPPGVEHLPGKRFQTGCQGGQGFAIVLRRSHFGPER